MVQERLPAHDDERPAGPDSRSYSRELTVTNHGVQAFDALRKEWNHVLSASDSPSVFGSWEWQSAWWRCFGSGKLSVLAFRGRNGDLAGIAPLYLSRDTFGGLPLRTLRLLGDGSGDGDDLTVLARRGAETAVASALLRHLKTQRGWDLLCLRPVPEGSGTRTRLIRLARAGGWATRTETLGCAHTPLPDSWDEYLGRLRPRFRSRLRAATRWLAETPGARVEEIRRATDLDSGLEQLFDLHSRRWQAAGESGVFDDSRRRAFFHEFGFEALRRGWLRLYALRLDDRTLAMQIGYAYDNQFLQIQEGFDPDSEHPSLGVVLRAEVMRRCIDEGLQGYDNLLGTPPHKMRWGAVARPVHRLLLSPPCRPGGLLMRLQDRFRPVDRTVQPAGE